MGAKLERLGEELEKARKKRNLWDTRVKDLELRYKEAENTEIHEMVHAANLTPEQLAELIRLAASTMPHPDNLMSEDAESVAAGEAGIPEEETGNMETRNEPMEGEWHEEWN